MRALALEKPEIADDSESEDRREWDMLGTTKRGPTQAFVRCVICMYVCAFCWLFGWYSIVRVVTKH